MRYLKTNTATRVTVGPFLDKSDGITPETALTVTGIKLTLVVDDGGVPTLVLDTNPTASGGNNDMAHITGDDAGFYDLELTAANLNYVGRAILALTDAANHCPVFHEFMILPAVIYDSLVGGTDLFDVSVTQIAGSAVSTSTAQLGVNAVQAGGTAWGSGAITAAAFAAGAIDAAAIAANAIGASELAADAVAEIADAIWDEAVSGHTTAGTFGKTDADVLAAVDTEIAAIKAKTDNLPAAPAATGDIPSAATIADAVWDELAADHVGAGSVGERVERLDIIASGGSGGLTNARAALIDNLDAAVSSRGTGTALDAAGVRSAVGLASANLDTQLAAIVADTDEIQQELADGGRIDLLIDAILADTGTDGVVVAAGSKTGYRLSATGVDDVLDEVVEGAYTMRQFLRLFAAALLGKVTGAATNAPVFRDTGDTTNRISATTDADGNRSAVTLDAS